MIFALAVAVGIAVMYAWFWFMLRFAIAFDLPPTRGNIFLVVSTSITFGMLFGFWTFYLLR